MLRRNQKKKRVKRSGTVSLLILFGALLLYSLLQISSIASSYSSAQFWGVMDIVLSVVFTLTLIGAILIVVLENKEPVKATAWILVLVLLPVVGILFYLFFGRNFRKERLFSRKELEDNERLQELSYQQQSKLPTEERFQDDRMHSKLRTMILLLNNNQALVSLKNRTKLMQAGEEAFQRIFDAIRNAQHHIHVESYIIIEDETGIELQQLLIEKAREGVEVRLIYDDVGSWSLSKDYLYSLQEAGVRLHPFLPVRFPLLASQLNYRNHRKMIVIDGKLAYTGGMNIADRYRFEDPNLGPWQDAHLEIEGEAVESLQAVFLTDWYFVEGEILKDEAYFRGGEGLEEENDEWLQVVTSGPDSEYASIMQAYFSAIVNARDKVLIANPYFIPNESIFTAMKVAALSGVEVDLVVPGKTDSWVTKAAGNSFIGELLDAGVQVYEYQKGFLHSKVMAVDDVFASVGSANMDHRSFSQNFEVNTLIYDRERTVEIREMIQKDMSNSSRIDPETFFARPMSQKLKESLIRLFAPIL